MRADAFPAGFAIGAGIESAEGVGEGAAALADSVTALLTGNGVEEAGPCLADAGGTDCDLSAFAVGAGIESAEGFGGGAAALANFVTAPLTGNGVAFADAGATDCDLRIAPRSLSCSPAAGVKLRDDGTTGLEIFESSAGCCRGTRKPTTAINVIAAKAAIPVASSPAENGLGAKVGLMMPRVKISKLMQLVQPAELARCRAHR